MENLANEYRTALNGSIDSVQTTIVVATAPPAALSGGNFRLRLGPAESLAPEYVLVGTVSGTTLSGCTRHVEGSATSAWPSGTLTAAVVTVAGLNDRISSLGGGADPLHLNQYLSVGPVTTASGLLTLTGTPAVGDTLRLGASTTVYTFVAPVDFNAPLEISTGTSIATARTNIIAAINGTDGQNTARTDMVASPPAAGQVLVTAIVPGSAGNTINSEYVNSGAGTNAFTAFRLHGGNMPASTGPIRLRSEEFLMSDDEGTQSGTNGDVPLIGFDADGQYICIGRETELPTVITGQLEVRSDAVPQVYKPVLLSEVQFIATVGGVGRTVSLQLADVLGAGDPALNIDTTMPIFVGHYESATKPGGIMFPYGGAGLIFFASGGVQHKVMSYELGKLVVNFGGLPTTDPAVVGQVWNNGGVLTVSAG